MAKVYIRNPKQLEGFVTNKLANELFFSSNLQDEIAETMQEIIVKNVYDAYEPSHYKRRGNNDGFSDMDNMEFTSVDVVDGTVRLVFENTADRNMDKSTDKTLTDIFEEGHRQSWYNPDHADNQGRVVSTPRPFIEDTVKNLNDDKGKLADALKKDLRSLGFKVK